MNEHSREQDRVIGLMLESALMYAADALDVYAEGSTDGGRAARGALQEIADAFAAVAWERKEFGRGR